MTNILYVDGDRNQSPALTRILAMAGYSISLERNFDRVPGYFGTWELAIIAVDDLEDHVRGVDALCRFKAMLDPRLGHKPILTIFDHFSSMEERAAALLGGNAFMERPVEKDEFLGSVERLARKYGCYSHVSKVAAAVSARSARSHSVDIRA